MTPQQIQRQIADGFEQAVRVGWPRTHVCFFDHNLSIRKTGHSTKRHPIFGTYSHSHLARGLHPREWDRLIRIILSYLKDHKLCPPLLKHSHQQILPYCLSPSATQTAPHPNAAKE